MRLRKGGFFSCQSQWSGGRSFQICRSPLRKERDVKGIDVQEADTRPRPARVPVCKCMWELGLGNRELAGSTSSVLEQEWIYISSVPSSRAGIGDTQKPLQRRRGNPCVLCNSWGLLLGTRGLGCTVAPAHIRAGPGSAMPGEWRRDACMPWPLGASARSSWKHLAWLSEPLGWGSRKQAGCINSQPNEYTKTAALLLLSSECGH